MVSNAGLNIVSHSPPPVGGGNKGFGDGEKNVRGKKEKKENLGKLKLLAVPNQKN